MVATCDFPMVHAGVVGSPPPVVSHARLLTREATGWFGYEFPCSCDHFLTRVFRPTANGGCHLVGRGPLWVTGGVFKREPFGKPGKATSASSFEVNEATFAMKSTAIVSAVPELV